MGNQVFNLRYLPIFTRDLDEIVDYITYKLYNPDAAMNLIEDIERAIIKRLDNPLSFEPFAAGKKRTNLYYRIYVRNYTVYYVVIEDVMEVRRVLYAKKDTENIID